MPTDINDLIARKLLRPWQPNLGPRRLPKRRLFVTQEFELWASGLPNSLMTSRHRLVSPAAELSEAAASFVSGEKIVSFMTRVDPPSGEGILRLRTASFALVGWCVAPQALVLAAGASKDETHGGGVRLRDLGRTVVETRRKMGLRDWEKGEFYELFRAED